MVPPRASGARWISHISCVCLLRILACMECRQLAEDAHDRGRPHPSQMLHTVCCMVLHVTRCMSPVARSLLHVVCCRMLSVVALSVAQRHLRGRIPVRGRLDDEAGEHARLLLREQEAAERPLLLTAQAAHGSVPYSCITQAEGAGA